MMLILHTFYLERLIILQDVTIRYTESVIQCRLMVVPGVTTKFVSLSTNCCLHPYWDAHCYFSYCIANTSVAEITVINC